jgi:hypothetical protein
MLLANAIKYKDGDRRRYDVAMVERWRWKCHMERLTMG